MKNTKFKITSSTVLAYLFLGVASFLSIFPFYWLFSGATNSTLDIMRGRLFFGKAFLANMKLLMNSVDIWGAFFNTLKITAIFSVLVLLITFLAAYGFEKFRSSNKEYFYKAFLLSMMIPFAALMIPLFRLVARLGIIDNYWAVILPGLASPFFIFFFRQNLKSFPDEIIEAARIDGASEIQIFFKIVIRPMKPAISAAAIFSFMIQWNNYLWPLITMQSQKNKTLTLVISNMSSAYFVEYGALMVGIVIATLPVIIIFFTMQKQFVQGMTGSSK